MHTYVYIYSQICMHACMVHGCMYVHIHTCIPIYIHRHPFYQNTEPGHHDPTYRIYIENLSRGPYTHTHIHGHLYSHIHQSTELISSTYRTSIDHLLDIYRRCTIQISSMYRRNSMSEINLIMSNGTSRCIGGNREVNSTCIYHGIWRESRYEVRLHDAPRTHIYDIYACHH